MIGGREAMIHLQEPFPFKAGARLALGPNAPEAPMMAAATRLPYDQSAALVALMPCHRFFLNNCPAGNQVIHLRISLPPGAK